MGEIIRVSNDKELQSSILEDNKITIINPDFEPEFLKDLKINYCFNAEPEESPLNFYCLKHVFHPYNYPSDIFADPYMGLMDKVLNGHELAFELTLANVKLLRFCQAFLGATEIKRQRAHTLTGESIVDYYSSCKNKKGNLSVPYIIGKCITSEGHAVPVWSYFWEIYTDWSSPEVLHDICMRISRRICISNKNLKAVVIFVNDWIHNLLNIGDSPGKMRMEGPKCGNPSKWWNEKEKLLKFVKARQSRTKSGYCLYEIIFNVLIKVVQNPDNYTDLAIPQGTAFEYAEGISLDTAKDFNEAVKKNCSAAIPKHAVTDSQSLEGVDKLIAEMNKAMQEKGFSLQSLEGYHPIPPNLLYTQVPQPHPDWYKTDPVGNIIYIREQFGNGFIQIYPVQRKDLADLPAASPEVESAEVQPLASGTSLKIKIDADAFTVNEDKTKKLEDTMVFTFLAIYAASVVPDAHFLFQNKKKMFIRTQAKDISVETYSVANISAQIQKILTYFEATEYIKKEKNGRYPRHAGCSEVKIHGVKVRLTDAAKERIQNITATGNANTSPIISQKLKDFILSAFE